MATATRRSRAASARFRRRAGEFGPVDLTAHGDESSDDLDAERRPDEGRSLPSETVRR